MTPYVCSIFQFMTASCGASWCIAERGSTTASLRGEQRTDEYESGSGGLAPRWMTEGEKAFFCGTYADFQERQKRNDWLHGTATIALAFADLVLAM